MIKKYPFFRDEDEQTIAVIGEEAAASDLDGTYQKPYTVLTSKRLYCKNESGNYITEIASLRSAGKIHLPGQNWFLWMALIPLAIVVVISLLWAWSSLNDWRVNEAQNILNSYDKQRVQIESSIDAVTELEQLEKSWDKQDYENLLNEYNTVQQELVAIQQGTYSDLTAVRALALSERIFLYDICGSDNPDVIAEKLAIAYNFAADYGIDPEVILPKEAIEEVILPYSIPWNINDILLVGASITDAEISAYIQNQQQVSSASEFENIDILVNELYVPRYEVFLELMRRDYGECNATVSEYYSLWDWQQNFYGTDENDYVNCVVADFFYRSCVAYLGGIEELPHSESELQNLVDSYAARISEADAINQQIEQYRSTLGVTTAEDTTQLKLNLKKQLAGLETEYHSAKTVKNEVQQAKVISIVLAVAVALLVFLTLLHRIKLAAIMGTISATISLVGWFISTGGQLTALPWILLPILSILLMLLAIIADRRRTVYQIAHTTGFFNFTLRLYPTAELKNFTVQVENLKAKGNPYV